MKNMAITKFQAGTFACSSGVITKKSSRFQKKATALINWSRIQLIDYFFLT